MPETSDPAPPARDDAAAGRSLLDRVTPGWVALVLSVVALGLAAAPYLGGAPSGFDAQVRASLMAHPEVIRDAVQQLQVREQSQAREAANAAIRRNLSGLHGDARDPAVGPADAAVTVVQFFDYRCPGCKAVAPGFREIMDDHPDVRFVFKEWPILDRPGDPPVSEYAARAALAAHAQGRFLPVHRALMAQPALDPAGVDRVLEANGVDLARARAAMDTADTAGHLEDVAALAQLIGAEGTPTFIVNGEMTESIDPAEVRAAIERAKRG